MRKRYVFLVLAVGLANTVAVILLIAPWLAGLSWLLCKIMGVN